ncbi:MAG TPA: hypothetical protein VGY54_06445 [Polyangiaceae bacterium]|nr:hypothetical protein [Polyangiaceae bacterium]
MATVSLAASCSGNDKVPANAGTGAGTGSGAASGQIGSGSTAAAAGNSAGSGNSGAAAGQSSGGSLERPDAAAGGPDGGAADDASSGGMSDAIGDAGTVAMPPSDAAAGACPAGALLCDDFEKYAAAGDLGAAWHVTANTATVLVDTTKAFKGKQALHISAPAGSNHMGLIAKEGAPLFPIAGNAFYGRMMMWLSGYPSGGNHWNTVQASGLLPNSTQTAKYAWGGDGTLGAITAGYTIRITPDAGTQLYDCYKQSTTPIPVQKWVCVEWKFDGVANEMHYWLDGQSPPGVDVIKTGGVCVTPPPPGGIWQAPVFSNLSLGWQQPNPSTAAIEMWVDEVAVDTQRIGCPAP